jgi:hypothetical protein
VGEETRSEGLPARARGPRDAADARPAARASVEQAITESAADLERAGGDEADANGDDQATELWTERWLARSGALRDFAPEIRVQNDTRRASSGASMEPAMAPPSLSWPPLETSTPSTLRTPSSGASPFVRALVPPRGDDPSLAPLPRSPNVPDFKRTSRRSSGRPHIALLLLLFVVLGALSALLAWESGPSTAIELLSVPSGAKVEINGAPQPGVTPLRVSGLRRGARYHFRLALAGYRPFETDLEATPETARHTIRLTPE